MKKTLWMKRIIALCLVLLAVFALAGCTLPAVSKADGSETVFGALLLACIDVGAKLAVFVLSLAAAAWANRCKDNEGLKSIGLAVDEVLGMAEITVGELQQTTVDALKTHSVDGKLTDEQIAELRAALTTKTLEKVSEVSKIIIKAAQIDICALILGKGESLIHEMHKDEVLLPVTITHERVSGEDDETAEA